MKLLSTAALLGLSLSLASGHAFAAGAQGGAGTSPSGQTEAGAAGGAGASPGGQTGAGGAAGVAPSEAQRAANQPGAKVGEDIVNQLNDVRESVGGLVNSIRQRGPELGIQNWPQRQNELNSVMQRLDQMEARLDQKEQMADDEQRVAINTTVTELSQVLNELNTILQQPPAQQP